MLGTLKMVAMLTAVVSTMIALVLAIVTWAFPNTAFARSIANWVLIGAPLLPLTLFYFFDRIDR